MVESRSEGKKATMLINTLIIGSALTQKYKRDAGPDRINEEFIWLRSNKDDQYADYVWTKILRIADKHRDMDGGDIGFDFLKVRTSLSKNIQATDIIAFHSTGLPNQKRTGIGCEVCNRLDRA